MGRGVQPAPAAGFYPSMKQVLAAILMVTAFTATAAADEGKSSGPDASSDLASGDCARARKAGKTCVLSMDGIDVEGGVATGEGSAVDAIDFGSFTSLIRIRANFIPEIIRAAEDL